MALRCRANRNAMRQPQIAVIGILVARALGRNGALETRRVQRPFGASGGLQRPTRLEPIGRGHRRKLGRGQRVVDGEPAPVQAICPFRLGQEQRRRQAEPFQGHRLVR